jgi:hypothetical protein
MVFSSDWSREGGPTCRAGREPGRMTAEGSARARRPHRSRPRLPCRGGGRCSDAREGPGRSWARGKVGAPPQVPLGMAPGRLRPPPPVPLTTRATVAAGRTGGCDGCGTDEGVAGAVGGASAAEESCAARLDAPGQRSRSRVSGLRFRGGCAAGRSLRCGKSRGGSAGECEASRRSRAGTHSVSAPLGRSARN